MHYDTTPRNLRRRLLQGSAAGLLLAQLALPGWAQTAPAASTEKTPAKPADAKAADDTVQMDEMTVTGSYMASLAISAERKEKAPVITEVIAAEDIGKLPDVSIADSLTRLTGLTTQRTNGRSQAISIRGLTGDFSTGMLNGREQVSTGLNRAVEYDQYPAELLNEVVVYKTAAANLTGQGLAGTVDLKTIRPLSRNGRIVAINGYYEWTQLKQLTPGASDKGERVNISYIDQSADGKLGVAFGYSHSNKPFQGQQFQAWGYPTDSGGNYALGGTKSYVRTSELARDGYMGVIEYKPSDSVHLVVDMYYSDFQEKQILRGMEIPLVWSSAVMQPGQTTSGGLVTKSTFTNVQPVVRNDIFDRKDSPVAFGLNLALGENSPWPVTLDAGYSRVRRNDLNIETWSGLGFRGSSATTDTMTVTLVPGEIPVIKSTLDYSSGSILRLTDPQGWGPSNLPGGGMYGYLKGFRSKDELGQFKVSTEHKLDSFFSNVDAGISYTDRYKRDGENPSGYLHAPTAATFTLPLPAKIGTTDMSFLGLGGIYAYDPVAAYNSGVFGFSQNYDTGIVANRFQVREKLAQLYTQFDLNGKLGDVPVTGNVGLRVIRTDQSSKGYSGNGNNLNAVSDGTKYTHFAPSLNLNFTVADQTYVRVSAARQLARPRMYDLRASRSWSYDPTLATSNDLSRSPWSGGGGNSKLKPWDAYSFDVSLEKYFTKNRGYVSLAAFHKDLRNYIYQQNSLADFTGYPVPSGSNPTLRQGVVSQPVNGSGGAIKGLEFTLSLSGELLAKPLHGFGIVLGGALTDSSVKPWGPTGGTAPIAGLSKKVANVTVYYERGGFSARVSERYRSANRQYITNFGVPNLGGDVSPNGGFSMAQPEAVLDAQLSYGIRSGTFKGLTGFIQAYNLNNEPLVTYDNDDPRRVINYQKYGASYSAGLAYSF